MTISRILASMATFATLAGALAPATSSAQQMFRCKNASGQTTYTDRACAPGPEVAPAAASKFDPATVNLAAGGKLTAASAEKVLRHALVLAQQTDYRGQCALAAPDVSFKITDHSTHPPTVFSGGRDDICALQQQAAQTIQAGGLSPAVQAGKIRLDVAADGKQASARYDTTTTFSSQGRALLRMTCSREETLGVYGDKILYKQANAVCRPQG